MSIACRQRYKDIHCCGIFWYSCYQRQDKHRMHSSLQSCGLDSSNFCKYTATLWFFVWTPLFIHKDDLPNGSIGWYKGVLKRGTVRAHLIVNSHTVQCVALLNMSRIPTSFSTSPDFNFEYRNNGYCTLYIEISGQFETEQHINACTVSCTYWHTPFLHESRN